MCGIVALVDPAASSESTASLGRQMLQVTHHRGPDYTGTWQEGPVFLGHNRLSIIDVTSASHQPMTRQHVTITYNGEVYNYIELREELERDGAVFSTTGDTEVILEAYLRWGDDCVQHFIGMWAFAIWDQRRQRLFCSRDRFGIKPFHYAYRNGRLHISSEIKALKTSPIVGSDVNRNQVARGLYLGWMQHWEETYFADILALPASHCMSWEDGKPLRIWQYATLDTHTESPLPFAEHAEQFRSLFTNSVQLTARRDVPMGICLSGGLDSTSIAATLASTTNEAKIKTFTAYYSGAGNVDERPYINHLLAAYPQIEAHYISPTDADVAVALERIVGMMDAPMPSSSYISQYFVMQLAAQHGVTVVLDGQGADEMLGGYMHSAYRVIADHLRTTGIGAAYNEWRAHSTRQNYGWGRTVDVLAKSVLTAVRDEPQLYRLEMTRTAPWVLDQPAGQVPLHLEMPSGSRFNAFLYNLMRVTLLPTLLHTEDLNSMAFSIESRVPFLDHRLVQASLSMPTAHRFHRGESKRVLRAAMRGVVPDAILDRRDKTGFITPGHVAWLRGALAHVLEGDWHELRDYANVAAVHKVVLAYQRGDNRHALFVWRLAMLRLFLRAHASRS